MWRSSASPTVLQWMRHVNHGLPIRWDRRLPAGGGAQRDHPRLGQRDRAVPHPGDQKALPRHDPCGGHHEIEWCEAAPGGHHLRRQPVSRPERGWPPFRSCRGQIRPVYGTNPHRKGDESGRCGKRANSSFYQTQIYGMGKCARLFQLGFAQGGGLPDRPRGNL